MSKGETIELFISYAQSDSHKIEMLIRCLDNLGISIIRDRDIIKIGDNLENRLNEMISRAGAALLVMSDKTDDSSWIQWEYERFREKVKKDKGFKILPVRLTARSIPDTFSSFLFYDYFSHNSIVSENLARKIFNSLTDRDAPVYTEIKKIDIIPLLFGNQLSRIGKSLNIDKSTELIHRQFMRIAELLKMEGIRIRTASQCECGGNIICGYIDAGGPDYYDNFFHICDNCYFPEHRSFYSSDSTTEEPNAALCPFCQIRWF